LLEKAQHMLTVFHDSVDPSVTIHIQVACSGAEINEMYGEMVAIRRPEL